MICVGCGQENRRRVDGSANGMVCRAHHGWGPARPLALGLERAVPSYAAFDIGTWR